MGVEISADEETEAWLNGHWDLGLDWDEANIGKLDKHALSVPEVEGLFEAAFIFAGRILPPKGMEWGEDRYLILGESLEGRFLTVVWTKRGNKIRPISVRSMRKNEKAYYQKTGV